ncbi:MAG: DUF2207 domain-containing protein [Nitriliruptoraceae bacterium]
MRILWRAIVSVVIAVIAFAIAAGVGWLGGLTDIDDAFTIEQFNRGVIVEADGATHMREVIDVTFSEPRRGIFRDLPDERRFDGGQWQVISIDRGRDGLDWNWVVESGLDGPRVRIGEASQWLEPGDYRYRLELRAPTWSHLLADDPSIVETRIDVPGYSWPTSVDAGRFVAMMPGEILEVSCVEGALRTVTACANEPTIDGEVVTIDLGPYDAYRSATVSILTPAAAFTGALPTYDATPLGSWSLAAVLPDSPVVSALIVAALVAAALLLIELAYSLAVYRDKVTDPSLHNQATPTAVFAPPRGLSAIETAGVLLRTAASPLFLAKLVDLDQRGLIRTSATEKGKQVELAVERNPDAGEMSDLDRKFIDALLPSSGATRFSGTYSAAVAKRVRAATAIVSRRARGVFAAHGLKHDGGKILRHPATTVLIALAVLGWIALLSWAFSRYGVLPVGAALGAAAVILVAWAIAHSLWALVRLPLNSEGRHVVAESKAFREFVRTVESEQLEWAAGQPGINHLHPALSLLPYAIVFGLADSWYDRFSGVMQQLAVASGTAAAAGGTAWWASQSNFSRVRSAQSSTTTAPSSSGGGGGGGGSGGGGGGGGSW